jgi:O-antigen/teichoic acid export membrane protein
VSTSVLAHSFGTLVLRGASFGIRVTCMLVMAGKAGPELFGTISLFFTMSEIARVVADCGVDTVMLRNMATQRGDELARSLGAALSAKLFSGALIGAGLLAAMFWLSPETTGLNVAIGVLALTPLVLNLGANYFIATQSTVLVGVRVASITILAGVAFVAVAFLSQGPAPLVLVVAAYELLLGGWLVWMALRTGSIRPKLSRWRALALVRTSLPLGIAIAVGYTYGKLDVFVLDRLCGREAVGQYSVWSRLLDPFLFVCGAVAVTAYGHLSRAIQDDDATKSWGIIRRYALLNLLVSGTAAALLLAAGDHLASRFLPSYSASVWIGQLLVILLLLRSVNAILTALLQAASRRKLVMLIALMNFAVALLASVSLAYLAGTVGVVSGLIAMETLNCAVQITCVRRVLVPAVAAPVAA